MSLVLEEVSREQFPYPSAALEELEGFEQPRHSVFSFIGSLMAVARGATIASFTPTDGIRGGDVLGYAAITFSRGRFMHFDDVKVEVIGSLREAQGHFLSAYQICQRLEVAAPHLWARLVKEYPSVDSGTPMGEGTGRKYSPATFVSKALDYFVQENEAIGLRKEMFNCEGVSFGSIAPGFTGKVVAIWAIKE